MEVFFHPWSISRKSVRKARFKNAVKARQYIKVGISSGRSQRRHFHSIGGGKGRIVLEEILNEKGPVISSVKQLLSING